MARCGDVGDEVGSHIIAVRQVVEIMRLCFLMERQYVPYFKWFGTAFNTLSCAGKLNPIIRSIFNSHSWQERQKNLSNAYLTIMEMHNALGLTENVEPLIASFHTRPYQVPHSDRFVQALLAEIKDEGVRRLPKHIGGVDQAVDSTDILSDPGVSRKFKSFFDI